MSGAYLFYGFQMDKDFENRLASVNPYQLSYFIKNDSDYLHEVWYEGKKYLGKRLEETASVHSLELLESNIFSLVQKLLPKYPCRQLALYLLAIADQRLPC